MRYPKAMRYPKTVRIVEVGPRDGLQNEAGIVSAATKIALIDQLAEAGLRTIEAGSFVSPKWVPQMADTAAVMAGIARRPGVSYAVLVPNLQGYDAARAAGADEVSIFAAATESFSRRNINCSIAESIARFAPVAAAARRDGVRVRGYVSCAIDCPYEGPVAPAATAEVAARLLALGCYEISLGDTLGTGTAARVEAMVAEAAARVSIERLAVHFHDTYGQAVANILVALEHGVAVVDSSVAGLGGCPFAPGAAGNVATEDVLYLLDGLGINTGVSLPAVAAAGAFITAALGRQPASKAARALAVKYSLSST